MRVFIHNFTYIEKGLKCRGKKFTYTNCCKPRVISNCFSTRSYLARAVKYFDKSQFGKQYFSPYG